MPKYSLGTFGHSNASSLGSPTFRASGRSLGARIVPTSGEHDFAAPPLDILRDNRSVRPLPAGTSEGPISAPIRAMAVIHARNSGLSMPARATRNRARCFVAVAISECPESIC